MTTTKLERIANMEKELAALKKDLKDEPKEWPQKGDTYYSLDPVSNSYWSRKYINCNTDKRRLDLGNFFRTNEEAEHYRDFLRVMAKLRRAAKGYKPTIGIYNYYLCFHFLTDEWIVGYITSVSAGEILFRSQEEAQAALASLTNDEKETLKKGWPT